MRAFSLRDARAASEIFACKSRRDSNTIPHHECQAGDTRITRAKIKAGREDENFSTSNEAECAQTYFCFPMGNSIFDGDGKLLRSPAAESRAELFEQRHHLD